MGYSSLLSVKFGKVCGPYVVMAKRLLVKKRDQKEVCCDEIELCAKKKRLNFRFNIQHNWEGLCELVKRKNIHSVKL